MPVSNSNRPIRIGAFSAVMGDRFDVLNEMVHAEPPVDVVIGDSMAEITMSMAVANFDRDRDQARSLFNPMFLKQIVPELDEIARRGIKVVTNAGVFNTRALADLLREEIASRGLNLTVAEVRGDDLHARTADLADDGQLAHLDTGKALEDDPSEFVAVNAYLGGWGIAAALRGGADIVLTGRVADASLVLGPAAWWHGWRNDELDKVAGGVAAAHIIECGPQATGGNFSGFTEIPDNTKLGYPIAEVAADGSSVITKIPGSGGAVTVDTVTAQLLYEIQGPLYHNPDVVLHIDSLRLAQLGSDRVQVTGAVGSPAPVTAKVAMHRFNGYRAAIYLFPTGMQTAEKVELFKRQAGHNAAGLDLDEVLFERLGQVVDNPATQDQSTVALRVAWSGPTEEGVRAFGSLFPSYGLGGIPGFYIDFIRDGGGARPQARIEYWPGLVRQDAIEHEVVFGDGRTESVPLPPMEEFIGEPVQPGGVKRPVQPGAAGHPGAAHHPGSADRADSPEPGEGQFGPTVQAPLGATVFTRVGDKGGNLNLGAWTPEADAYDWLCSFLTEERITELLSLEPEIGVERYEMPRLHGLSFVLTGYFGASGSSYLGLDQIGKAAGEFIRARYVEIPERFVNWQRVGLAPPTTPAT